MYKNIIFDFGGVVVNFNPRDFLMDHFMNRRAEEETYDIVFGSQEWQDLDRGIITREEANKIMPIACLRCRPALTSGSRCWKPIRPLCRSCAS